MNDVTRGQALELMARFGTQIDWKSLDGHRLQENVISLGAKEFGRRFAIFLNNDCKVIVSNPGNFLVDRSQPVDVDRFLSRHHPTRGWKIWKRPADEVGLHGVDEHDTRSRSITELNLTKILLQNTFQDDYDHLTGEKWRSRLMSQAVQADLAIAYALCEEREQVTLRWIRNTFHVNEISFLGTTLRSPEGCRSVINLVHTKEDYDGGYWFARPKFLEKEVFISDHALGFAG